MKKAGIKTNTAATTSVLEPYVVDEELQQEPTAHEDEEPVPPAPFEYQQEEWTQDTMPSQMLSQVTHSSMPYLF
jgi:hypothetical protein